MTLMDYRTNYVSNPGAEVSKSKDFGGREGGREAGLSTHIILPQLHPKSSIINLFHTYLFLSFLSTTPVSKRRKLPASPLLCTPCPWGPPKTAKD